MPNEKNRKIMLPKGGVFNDLANHVKLIIRLMRDPRVNPLLKLLPVGTLVYLINPIDIPGPFDDVAVIWLGTYLFIELCPPDVVQEHMTALKQVVPGEWHEPRENGGEVIDAEYWEKKDEK
jgi:hypothetical protein